MDARFYKFWENLIRQAGSGQVGLDDLSAWTKQSADISGTLMEIFKKTYGLDHVPAGTPDYSDLFESAVKEFNQSLETFYAMLDVVSRKDYLDLEKKYKALKRKVADQEEVISHLKLLFKTHPPNVEEGARSLNNMLKSQNESFLKMMDSLAGFYGITKDKDKDIDKDDD